MNTPRHRLSAMLAFLLLAAAIPGAAQAPAAPPDPEAPGLELSERLDRLIARIKWEQARLHTLEASFVQNKSSPLLLTPEESRGKLWLRTPDRARWDFVAPDATVVLLKGDTMLTWHRELEKAERLAVGGQADRAMQFLSASNSLESLQRYFTLQVSFPRDPKEPFRLELKPRFDRVAQRVRSMAIHLDRQGYHPVFVQYTEPSGARTELRFSDVKRNQTIDDSIFELELPPGVEVKTIELGGKTGSGGS